MVKEAFNPLGKASTIIEQATQLKVTYAYDDLVFVEHNPFLLRFDQKDADTMHLHFNVDCEEAEANRLEKELVAEAEKEGLALAKSAPYEMFTPEDKEEIQIRFQE